MNRLSWEEYALELAKTASKRSEDPYKKVGCALLRLDNSIGGLGYNGIPSGKTIDWSNRDERRIKIIHAEQNALRYVKPKECYLAAVTLLPCQNCLMNLISYSINTIVFSEIYDKDDSAISLCKEFNIKLIKL